MRQEFMDINLNHLNNSIFELKIEKALELLEHKEYQKAYDILFEINLTLKHEVLIE